VHLTLSDWLRRMEVHYGPVNKGNAAKGDALTNATTGQTDSSLLLGEGQNAQAGLLPFLNQEVTNPQGFGQPALNAMTTATGQAVSGATSAANQNAKLQAARTGNPAAQSAIIANAARTGQNAQSDANLDTTIQNAELKQRQQQAGASGLMNLTGLDTKAALDSLGLSDESINAWSGANKSAGNLWSNAFLPLINDASSALGRASTGGGGGAPNLG
jgi:hypothetical protein